MLATNQCKCSFSRSTPAGLKTNKKPPRKSENHASRQELVEQEGIVYKGHNILIPPRLRSETLRKLHTSHQGIEKTKRLARQCIFWPGMNSQIEDTVSKCSTCLQHRNANHREPLQPHQLPSRPWQRVATDLFDWKGHAHLIVVDYYSRYPEVAELRDSRAKTVIAKTKSFFSRHGIPEEVVSDNGPQYSAREYKEFAEDYGFVHTQSAQGTHSLVVFMKGPYRRSNNCYRSAAKVIKIHISHFWIIATRPSKE